MKDACKMQTKMFRKQHEEIREIDVLYFSTISIRDLYKIPDAVVKNL